MNRRAFLARLSYATAAIALAKAGIGEWPRERIEVVSDVVTWTKAPTVAYGIDWGAGVDRVALYTTRHVRDTGMIGPWHYVGVFPRA